MGNRRPLSPQQFRRDKATLEIIHLHHVSVRKMALALEVSRQTVYRRMQAFIRYSRQLQASRTTGPGAVYNHHLSTKPQLHQPADPGDPGDPPQPTAPQPDHRLAALSTERT